MVTEKKKNLSVKKTKEKLLVITNGAKKRNHGVHATWINWSILLLTSLIISILLFPGVLIRPPSYGLGDIADKDIKASRDFLVEDVELTEQKRREAVKVTPPVFDLDPTGSYILSRIREAFSAGRKGMVVQSPVKEDGQGPVGSNHVQINQELFSQLIGVQVDEETYNILSRAGFPPEVENTIIKLLSRVLDRGVIGDKNLLASISSQKIVLHNLETGKETVLTETNEFLDMKEAANFIRKEVKALRPLMPKELRAATIDLAMQLLRPNITFNKRETELRKEAAKESVKPFYFKVKKGEMLVREGEKITKKHLLKLSEHSKYLRPKRLLGHLPAMFILVGLLLLSFYYLSYRPVLKGKPNPKNLVFCSIVLLAMLLVVMASHLVVSEIIRSFTSLSPTSLLFAIPVASASMLLSIFHGLSVATGLGAVLSILSSLVLGHGVELFVYFFVSSLVAAYGVRECRERGVFIKTGLKLSLINVLMALAVETLHGPTYGIDMLYAGASAFVGGMLVAVIATGSLPLIEMAFGYTTDIKLLELASLDQPLLRRLLLEAPGTYHHSVIVSNMVEATAKAVGANPLLAKVAAYYHDIGKMKKALYFIENQLPGQNKHEKLAPSMSALILISHVKDGVELARKHKLGNEIMDIIGQHHGTTLITYFYEKAREQAEKREGKTIKVKEEDFRYPGPKPQTKEAGLVMLADMVEAASKSLADPTPARIQGLVQKIINRAFSDGQLDECELTLKDLHQIAKSFNKTLTGIFHQRIEYPGIEIGSSGGKKASNGNLNQVGLTNSRAEKAGNKEENGETLRRLGLS